MKNYEWFMGIDVSKGKLDITLLKGSEKVHYAAIENSVSSIAAFVKELQQIEGFEMCKCLVCAEHTGIYNAHLLTVSQKQLWNLCLESAVQIKQSGGLQRGKNDAVDSYRIALYVFKHQPFIKLWQPPREVITKLKKLTTLRHRLINIKKQLTQPLEADTAFETKQTSKLMQRICKAPVSSTEKSIAEVEKQIKEVIDSDVTLKRLFAIVESVPGVGRIVATEIIVTTNEFKNIDDPRKYACYSGVAPFEHSSGSSVRGKTRTSKRANQRVKSLLHMASLTVMLHDKEMNIYYLRKVESGKNKMSVLNAIKNKLLHRIFACVKGDRYYEKNYSQSLFKP